MALEFTAILPKKYTSPKGAVKQLDKLLLTFAVEGQRRLKKYPPAQPWKNPPKTGLRAGGKRTGDLGRGWDAYTLKSGESIEMVNAVGYAPYVQGNKSQQARALAARGWTGIDVIAKEAAEAAIKKVSLVPE